MGPGSVPSPPQGNRFPISRKGLTPAPGYLITTAAALRVGNTINRSCARNSLLQASFEMRKERSEWLRQAIKKKMCCPENRGRTCGIKYTRAVLSTAKEDNTSGTHCSMPFPHMELSHIVHEHGFKNVWRERAVLFKGLKFLEASHFSASSLCFSCLSYFGKNGSIRTVGDGEKSYMETPKRKPFNGRLWTNVLLAINVLVYVAELATHGKLMLWGAKINSLIDKGQLWRLATSSFLHANVGHLMVNCYSLNSVGPTMEMISGPRRFLAVYFTSAVASCAASYWFCKAPAVGASGAIFGVVGSFAVFVLRHRTQFGGGKEDLQQIARVIALNMAIGLLSKGIDNWGHLGGLLGGAAVSWFLGPAWTYESKSADGRSIYTDKAPIFYLTGKRTVA